jgi:hypothetical protein
MSSFTARIAKLESIVTAKCSEPKRWHRIIQDVDQTQAEAIAEYERENAPISPEDGTIIRRLVYQLGRAWHGPRAPFKSA